MHHLYPTSTGDPLCPLGFHPQVRWPTRCKRCFRDYKDHKDVGGKKSMKDITVSSPSLSICKQKLPRSTEKSEANGCSPGSIQNADSSNDWCSTKVLSSLSLSDLRSQEPDVTVTVKTTRPKTYAGTQSDTYNFRRFSVDESLTDRHDPVIAENPTKHKFQIKNVIDKSNGATSENDAEFVIQVKKSRIIERIGKDDYSIKKEIIGGKTENQEIEKIKTQLNDMRARCNKLEKEKADILLRRLSAMDSTSLKSSGNDILKLQKTIKDLQIKNDTLTEERTSLTAKIKGLEKELNLKTHKNERERVNEELCSKLKATEMLCESLMDENEDMKKEIRELEEEIYEMQDNFREEQVDEYTTIRKNLEQSNKNCRILSFKLRKIERKAEQLEADKTDLEKKYEQIKKIEDILKKIGAEYKNQSMQKLVEYPEKVQLDKLIGSIEKDIGDVLNVMLKLINGRESGVLGCNFKYDKLYKEHELLKDKYNKTLKELTHEKEMKTKSITTVSDLRNEDLINLKKKLEESQASHELERKSWDTEKVKLQEEKEKYKSKLLCLSADKLKVYNEVVQLKKELEAATSSKKEIARMEAILIDLKKELLHEKDHNKKLQDDLSSLAEKESKLTRSLITTETIKYQLQKDLKEIKLELENAKISSSAKVAKTRKELSTLKKEKEKLNIQLEKEKQSKDMEIENLKKKNLLLEKTDLTSKRIDDLKQSYDEKIITLENETRKVSQQYSDLSLEQEKLLKCKLQLENENQLLNGQLIDHKQNYKTQQAELQEVRQFYKIKEMEWSSQQSQLEEQLHEYEKNTSLSQNDLQDENLRLRKESSSLTQQIEDLKKANDDLSGKLQDYTHVAKIQRNFSIDSSMLESELRKAKNTAINAEKARKADLAQCKLRYEKRVTAIGEEIKSIQAQLTKYKCERDTYKQMLEGAQKTIADLKSAKPRKQSTSSIGKSDEDEQISNVTRTLLEKQITLIEDELSEAKLESSKLKTELISEKSASEIKVSEMQSRINELEEERLLASGRTKIPGLKVRMELAWQKEREDQQRLLQETATLARDLRQTLFEIERERDKERLENKRKQDQLKKIFNEEKDENKKKLIELQCDLLELRDAHAKLRTSNEKMRREKECHDRDREELRRILTSKRHSEQVEARNFNTLLQQLEDLMMLFPKMNESFSPPFNGQQFPETDVPTPPRRLKGPKSRESSPMLDSKEENKTMVIPTVKAEKLEYIIKKLIKVAVELQESKKAADQGGNRYKKMNERSLSTDNDKEKNSKPTRSKSSLKRKSLSLEQTIGRNEQSIWRNNNTVSSLQSLNGSEVDSHRYSLQRNSSIERWSPGSDLTLPRRFDLISLDHQLDAPSHPNSPLSHSISSAPPQLASIYLSTESTKSEILRYQKKYNKGIIHRITTKLTKSASIEDLNSSFELSLPTSASETSIVETEKKDKKNLKKKLSNIFKRNSKNNRLDKKLDLKDNSRPSSRTSTTSVKL